MHPARIAELLEPFLNLTNDQRPASDDHTLTTNDLSHISTYIDLLFRWNARINLTAIRDPEQIVTRHFGESLFAARHLFVRSAGQPQNAPDKRGSDPERSEPNDERRTANDRLTLADVGSGAGFPGLPIKLWAPHIALTLIESSQKKATFLREVTRALTLTDVNIQTTRAETLATTYSVVTLRAVERFDAILPIAARLLAPGGRLALLIGSSQLGYAQRTLPNLAWAAPISIPLSDSRLLAIAVSSEPRP